jgi:hypothetical protein
MGKTKKRRSFIVGDWKESLIRIWRTRTMIVASVFNALFMGIMLVSAKEQASDASSEGRRMILRAQQDPGPQLSFRKIENKEATEWALGNEAEEKGLELFSHDYKIYPLDKETVFFFGGLRTPAVSIRSFLLRSGDGGKSWRDVMTPVHGSDVWDVFFLDSRLGWALTVWTTEGFGEVKLHSSKDGGIRWRKVSDIPKRAHTGEPLSMKFVDEKNGEIEMLYENGLAVLRTKDGGLTWAEIQTLSLDEHEKRGTGGSGQDILQAKDGSQWQSQERDGQVRVLRRVQANEAWKEMCAIPMNYGYSKGQVFVDQNKR